MVIRRGGVRIGIFSVTVFFMVFHCNSPILSEGVVLLMVMVVVRAVPIIYNFHFLLSFICIFLVVLLS